MKIAQLIHQKRELLQIGQIKAWMDVFFQIQAEYSIETCDTYNMDEKGVLLGMLKNISVICKKTDIPTNLIHSGNCELASILECISATGIALPPLIIFKEKRQMKAWHDALPKSPDGESIGTIACSDSGWTNNAIGYEWIVEFDAQSRKYQKRKYRHLIVDGHDSHITIKVVQFCISKKIILTKMPLHSTHLLQPLNVGIFGPLAIYYQDGLQNLSFFYFNVDKVDFIKIYFAARIRAMSEKNILYAWRDSGYFLFNSDVPCKTMLAKETPQPETPPNQEDQTGAENVPVNTPYFEHQVNHYVTLAAAQGHLTHVNVFKLAKAAKVNKAKATMKEIQCNQLIDSKAHKARKKT